MQQQISNLTQYVKLECFLKKVIELQNQKENNFPHLKFTTNKGVSPHLILGFRFHDKAKTRNISLDLTIYKHEGTYLFLLEEIQAFIHRYLICLGKYDINTCIDFFKFITSECLMKF